MADHAKRLATLGCQVFYLSPTGPRGEALRHFKDIRVRLHLLEIGIMFDFHSHQEVGDCAHSRLWLPTAGQDIPIASLPHATLRYGPQSSSMLVHASTRP